MTWEDRERLVAMELPPVTSSLIQAIGWDEATSHCVVRFHDGALWAYPCQWQDYSRLARASSVGKEFVASFKQLPGEALLRSHGEATAGPVATPVYLALLQVRKRLSKGKAKPSFVIWQVCNGDRSLIHACKSVLLGFGADLNSYTSVVAVVNVAIQEAKEKRL